MVAQQFDFLLAQKDAEITRLHEELARLREELSRVLVELARTTANTRELSARIEKLTDAIARSNERVSELLAIVGRKKKKPPAAPKAQPEPSAPLLDEAAREAFENRPQPPSERLLCDRPRPKQVPTGRKPIPRHLVREDSTVYPGRGGEARRASAPAGAAYLPQDRPVPGLRGAVDGQSSAVAVRAIEGHAQMARLVGGQQVRAPCHEAPGLGGKDGLYRLGDH